MKAIGIDIGTSTISAVVFDHEQQEVLKSCTIENGSFIKTGEEWERLQDAGEIVRKAKAVLDGLIDQFPDVSAIGLTGQMHGIVYVDQYGHACSPLYTWQDQRGNLRESGTTLVEQINAAANFTVCTGYGLVTHLFQKKHKNVPGNVAGLCTIPDYFGMELTGRSQPLLHISMAASLGFFDSRSGTFDIRAYTAMGGDTAILPEVTDEMTVLGVYGNYPVMVAIGDNQASFIGSVGFEENTLLLNVGTGGQISVLSDRYFEAPGIETRPLAKKLFLLVGSSLCGGRSYAILEQFFRSYAAAAGLGEEPQYRIMELLAREAVSAKEEMIVTTTFDGTRVHPDAKGSITGLSEETFTPGGLILGVLKGISRELYDMYQTIYNGTGIRVTKMIGSGNAIRKNEVLQQIAREMFGTGLVLAAYQEEAACGAAIYTKQLEEADR